MTHNETLIRQGRVRPSILGIAGTGGAFQTFAARQSEAITSSSHLLHSLGTSNPRMRLSEKLC